MSKLNIPERSKNESDFAYKERLIVAKIEKELDIDWCEIVEILKEDCSVDHFRKVAKGIYESYLDKQDKQTRGIEDKDIISKLQEQKIEIQKERYKLQTEKNETNKWLRENARDDLIVEKIIDAINILPPLKVPEVLPVIHSKREYALFLGDEHYGAEFEIKGLFGETLNEYSPEIFERRMWDLLNQTIEIVRENSITKLNVFEMGDFVDGLIRVKQLMMLRYGVIESTVRYANFLCNWLNKLTEYVVVEFQMVYGNHSELRLLNQPKGTFTNENTGLYVREIISARLENNPNFHMTVNPTGLIFTQILGMNILGIHGECKNLGQSLKDFSNTYNVNLHFIAGGHLHHSESENVGLGRDVIRVPSIIGIDDFSMSLNKTSNAGATLIVFEENFGKVREYNIKLK